MKKIICTVFVFLVVISGIGVIYYKSEEDIINNDIVEIYKEAVMNTKYIMHALGGMEGSYSYTNSIDALTACYNDGYRFFEVDVSFTSDEQLVCAHTATVDGVENVWRKADWTKRIGIEYDEEHPTPSFEEFMSFTIQGKFKATSFSELVDFMARHKDMYVMLDINCRSYEGTKKIYEAIVKTANNNADVLNRFIAGGHTTDMIEAVEEVYDFPLLNLYYADKNSRQNEINTPENFVIYCSEHGISSFSVAYNTFTEENLDLLYENLIAYVFTVNDSVEAKKIHEKGLVVGTDFLRNE